MANTGFKGVDVRLDGNQLIFDAFFQTSGGALETAGPVTVKVYEIQSDSTLKSYDFNNNTFVTTALTTETLALTHRKGNNNTTNTGWWSAALSTLTGFTIGGMYLALFNDTSASPTDQMRKFQYGSSEGTEGNNCIEDAVLVRAFASTTAAAGQPDRRSLMNAARRFVNHVDTTTNPGSFTVTREDDATAAFTQIIVTNAAAQLITQMG